MVRGHALLLTLALAPALVGCSGGPDIVSDGADLDAAVAVWSDPWVAPTSATVAGPALGSNGQVDRVVARRTTTYAEDVEAAAQSELRWARSNGWSGTSSTCGDAVQVALVSRSGDALAQLVVTPDGEGAEAALQVVTRHHLDATWPAPDTVARSCLTGESPPFEPPPLASAPLGDPDAADDATAEWDETVAESGAIDAANADPALRSLGLSVTAPSLADGVNRRRAPAAEGSAPASTLGELAAELDGWTLTYAACGGGGATTGTFARTLAGDWAVVSASLAQDGTDLRVTLPITEAPDPSWLDDPVPLAGSACLADTSRLPRQSAGIPAVLPSDLTPIAD